jgi:predicted amidohydrolase
MSAPRTLRIAAIQPALELGRVEENLRRLEDLIRDAHREHAPAVITLPEAAASPNVYDRRLRTVARPVDGAPFQLFTRLARELDCVIGGGFVARRDDDAFGTYVLAEPDGSAHLHDKDIPTAWEHNYYRGGDDDGITRSNLIGAPVGLACGWEWARTGTARRLRGNVELLLGGMCWPSMPRNWRGPYAAWARREHGLQLRFARALPGQVARMIGAPVAMPSHVGDVAFETPLAPGLGWSTQLIGETQICERDGRVLARLAYEDGEGHVAADVALAPPTPVEQIPDRYWIPKMTASIWAAWYTLNAHGALKYRALRALGRHPWQAYPGGDLPDEIPPSDPAQAPAATS